MDCELIFEHFRDLFEKISEREESGRLTKKFHVGCPLIYHLRQLVICSFFLNARNPPKYLVK